MRSKVEKESGILSLYGSTLLTTLNSHNALKLDAKCTNQSRNTYFVNLRQSGLVWTWVEVLMLSIPTEEGLRW